MRWHEVVPAWLERLNADAELTTLLGGAHIYPEQASRPVRIPSVEWSTPHTDIEGEWTNRFGFQVDYWAHGVHKGKSIERRLRLLTHHDYGQVLDGERLWFRYVERRPIPYTAEPGVLHVALDFVVECVRDKYAA